MTGDEDGAADLPDDLDAFVTRLVEEQGYRGAALVVTSDEYTDTYGEIAADHEDPQFVSFWMLGAHLTHVTRSIREAGGTATLESVCAQAVGIVREFSE